MKNIVIVLLMLVAFSVTAQNKQKVANDCYMVTAASTFSLSEANKTKLDNAMADRLKERREIGKKVKAGDITKEESKPQMRTINQKYFTEFASITGKSKKEVQNFEKETRKACNTK